MGLVSVYEVSLGGGLKLLNWVSKLKEGGSREGSSLNTTTVNKSCPSPLY